MSWIIEDQIRQQASQQSNDVDILICTPTRDGRISQHWQMGRMELEMPPNKKITMSMESGQPVDISRNISITRAFQLNAKHILFWDADVIPPRHTLNTLLQLNMPVVGAVYRSRGPPFQILASKDGVSLSDELLKQPPQIVEVDTIGAGFLLVDTRVLHRYARKVDNWQCLSDHTKLTGEFVAQYTHEAAWDLGYKCAHCKKSLVCSFFDYRAGKTRKLPLSEDYYFCYKVKELGFKIFAATVCCVHENSFAYVGQEPKLETWLSSSADIK